MTIYGNHTAVEAFAKIKDLSLTMQLTGILKEEEYTKHIRPNDEEGSLIRRLRRYKSTRREAIKRLKKKRTSAKEMNLEGTNGQR